MISHWMLAIGLPMFVGGAAVSYFLGGPWEVNLADKVGVASFIIGSTLLTLGASAWLVGF